MYSQVPGLVLGFHGCDQDVAAAVVAGRAELKPSKNDYDWLGHGTYFWEFNPQRAREFAEERAKDPRGSSNIKKPAVLGAVIELGYCLNLADSSYIDVLRIAYQGFEQVMDIAGQPLPANKPQGQDALRRTLDCAVIEYLHASNHHAAKSDPDSSRRRFDSVRGVFPEGRQLYEGAGFWEKTHVQICIRNPNCIKGYFLPRSMNRRYPRPGAG